MCLYSHSVRLGPYFSLSHTFTASGMAWVSKNPIFFLQINLFSFCARIEPKLSKLQKTVKIDKRSSKKPCFLIVFRIFSILGSILAQKTTKSKYLSIVPFICHPGHPWSCESSGVITTLISLFKIFQQQRHLVTFFNFPKMKPKITIIDLRLLERSLYAAIFTIVKIARHYIIFWWKYGKSRSQIWHCAQNDRLNLSFVKDRHVVGQKWPDMV
jgi:hypothetical protein